MEYIFERNLHKKADLYLNSSVENYVFQQTFHMDNFNYRVALLLKRLTLINLNHLMLLFLVRRCKSLTRPRVPPPPPPVSNATTPVPPNVPLASGSMPGPAPPPTSNVQETLSSIPLDFSIPASQLSSSAIPLPPNIAPEPPVVVQPTLSPILSNTSPQNPILKSTQKQDCSSTLSLDSVTEPTGFLSSTNASSTIPGKIYSTSSARGPIPPPPPRLTSMHSAEPIADSSLIPKHLCNEITVLDSPNSMETIAQSSQEMCKDDSKTMNDQDKVISSESEPSNSSLDVCKSAMTNKDVKSLTSFTTGTNRMSTFFSDNSSHFSSTFSSRPTMPTSSFIGLSSLPKLSVDHSSTTFSLEDTLISNVSTSAALLPKSPSTSSILDNSLTTTPLPRSSSVDSKLETVDSGASSNNKNAADESHDQLLKLSNEILTIQSNTKLANSDYSLPRILSVGGNRDSWDDVRSPSPPPLPTTSPPPLTPPSLSWGKKEEGVKILCVKKEKNEDMSVMTEVYNINQCQ